MQNPNRTLLIMSEGSGVLRGILAKRFKSGSFLRNVSIVMSGTAFAQVIGFFLMPVVSRLFTKADFGVYGSFTAVLGVLSPAVTLQYSQALMLPKQKEDAFNLFFVSCLSVTIVTGFCVMAVVIFPTTMMGVLKAPSSWFLLLLPVAVLASGLYFSLQAWSVRVKAFKYTSASQVISSLSSSGVRITTGLGRAGAIGLVFAVLLSSALASLNLLRVLLQDIKELFPSVSWKRMKELSWEFRDFPFFSATQNMMNALSQGLPVLLLGHFYGIGVAGSYAFGMRILLAPMGIVLTALRQVLFQKASETHNNGGDLWSLFVKTTGGLLAVAVVPCIAFFVWSPQIFATIFGSEWLEAGVYARWLILWLFIAFCNVPSVLFARILRQQRNLFIWHCSVLLLRTMILIIGGFYYSVLTTVISISVVGFILNAVLVLWIGALLFFQKYSNRKGFV